MDSSFHVQLTATVTPILLNTHHPVYLLSLTHLLLCSLPRHKDPLALRKKGIKPNLQ